MHRIILSFLGTTGLSAEDLDSAIQRTSNQRCTLTTATRFREATALDLEGTGITQPAVLFRWGGNKSIWALHVAAVKSRVHGDLRVLSITAIGDEDWRFPSGVRPDKSEQAEGFQGALTNIDRSEFVPVDERIRSRPIFTRPRRNVERRTPSPSRRSRVAMPPSGKPRVGT